VHPFRKAASANLQVSRRDCSVLLLSGFKGKAEDLGDSPERAIGDTGLENDEATEKKF